VPTLPPIQRFVSSSGVRIYRIPCQVLKDLSARVYLLLGAGPPTLLDAGSGQGDSTRHILAGLERVRDDFGEPIRATDVKRIIISHGHVDHVGGLGELLHHTSAEVLVHPLDQSAVASCRERAIVVTRRLAEFLQHAGVNPTDRPGLLAASGFATHGFDKLPVARTLSDGQQVDGLRVIHTPGHSPGLVCLAVGNILLCADHILARTIPQIWPESLGAYTGLGHYLDSLEKVRQTGGFELALAAHEAVMHDVYHRIEAIRASHTRRLERLLGILRGAQRPLSIQEITRKMYSDAHGFRAALALTDVGARVEFLHQRAQIVVTNLDEVAHDEYPVYRYAAQ